MNQIIISRLIEAGYDVYLPLNAEDILVISEQGILKKVFCCNAFADADASPILKSNDKASDCSYLSAIDKATSTVWLIPIELLESRTMIRLGKKYEDYVIPAPLGLTFDEQRRIRQDASSTLTDLAREIAEKLQKGMQHERTRRQNQPM